MADYKKSLYNIVLGNQGFLLHGTPTNPVRTMSQSSIFGNRYAMGDRDYTDFTFWWYWAQTDWSGGAKDEISWKDDAKHYFSQNIDAYSSYGNIKQQPGIATEKDFGVYPKLGLYGDLGGVNYHFAATNTGTPKAIWQKVAGTWSNISTTNIANAVDCINQLFSVKRIIWIMTEDRDADNEDAVLSTVDGAAYVDTHAAAIKDAGVMNYTNLYGATTCEQIADSLYVAVYDGSTSPWKVGVAKTNDNGATWTKVFDYNGYHKIISMKAFGSNLYYLVSKGTTEQGISLELRVYNIDTAVGSTIWTWYNTNINHEYFVGGNYLHLLGSKLIITIPLEQIWSYDLSSGILSRIFKKDARKKILYDTNYIQLKYGGIEHDSKIWWGNLVYDDLTSFHTKLSSDDATCLYPVISDGSLIYWIDSWLSSSIMYKDSGYKGATGKNWIVLNNIDTISAIQKLWNSCTVVFSALVANQIIRIDYSADEMASWTQLGTIEYAIDGGEITQKTFYFDDNTIFNKLALRIKLESGGSNSCEVKDISVAYYPLPEYKQKWGLAIKCFDDLVLLDGKTQEPKRGEELRNILKTYWKNKNVVEFQDIDFAETLLNGDLNAVVTTIPVDSTASFPEQGIIRISQEKIKYTGKTAVAFTGCVRGYEGTVAVAHSDNAVCSNSYKVIITNYAESTPVGAKTKINEFIVELQLIEI